MNLNKLPLFFFIGFLTLTVLSAGSVLADSPTFQVHESRDGNADAPLIILHDPSEYLNGDTSKPLSSQTGGYQGLGTLVPLWINQGGTYGDLRQPLLDLMEFEEDKSGYDVVGTTPQISIAGSGSINSTPAIVEGKLYFGTSASRYTPLENTPYLGMWCVDTYTNKLIWNTTITNDTGTPVGVVSGISVDNNKLYFGTVDGKLMCMDAGTGEILWNTSVIDATPDTGLSSTPLVIENTSGNPDIYVTTASSLLGYTWIDAYEYYELTEDGQIPENTDPIQVPAHLENILSITFEKGSAAFSSPSTDGTSIYSSGENGIIAVDLADKTKKWSVQIPYGNTSTPVYRDNKIFFTTTKGIYSISSVNGEELWKNESHQGLSTAPAVTDSVVVANSKDGLVCYDLNGSWRWTHIPTAVDPYGEPTPFNTQVSPNSPIIGGNIVYYSANIEYVDSFKSGVVHSANVYGVNLDTGESEKKELYNQAGGKEDGDIEEYGVYLDRAAIYTSSPVLSDGFLFVGTGSYPPDPYDDPVSVDIQMYYEKTYQCMFDVNEEESLFFCGSFPYSDLVSDSLIIRGTATPQIQNKIILPSEISFTPTGQSSSVSYTTVIGAFALASDETGKSYEVTGTSLKTLLGVESIGDYTWEITKNGISAALTDTVVKGDVICAQYSSPTIKGVASIELTVDDIRPFAEITLLTNSTAVSTAGETTTITAQVIDYKGNTVTDAGDRITWKNSGSCQVAGNGPAALVTINGDGQVTATYSAPSFGTGSIEKTISVKIASEITGSDTKISDYTLWKGGNARTGALAEIGCRENPEIKWVVNFDTGNLGSMPLVDGSPITDGDGNIYFTIWSGGMSGDNTANGLYSYTKDGTPKWTTNGKATANVNSRTSATYHSGKLYIGNIGGGLQCLDATTGTQLWSTSAISVYPYTGLTANPLVITRDQKTYVYVVTSSGNSKGVTNYFYAFQDNGNTYTQIAQLPLGAAGTDKNGGIGMYSSVSSSPDGSILYAAGGGGIVAIDAKSFVRLWTFDAGARGPNNLQYIGTPVYSQNSVYFATTGALYCLNAGSGTVKWKVSNPAILASTPVVTDTQVIAAGYVTGGNQNQYIYGIAGYVREDGHILWHYDEGDPQKASPIVAGNTAYYGTYKNEALYAVDITRTDGGEANCLWRFSEPAGGGWLSLIEATPLIIDDTIYIGGENAKFYALGPNDKTSFKIIGTKTVDTGVEASFTTNTTSNAYSWNFGDGTKTTGTASSIKKIWKTAGTYTVTASSGANTATFTVTVTTPPKAFNENPAQNPQTTATVEVIATPTQVPANVATEPGNNVSIKFSNEVIENAGTVTVQVTEYQAVLTPDAEVTLDTAKYTTPPNTQKAVFLMNVSTVENVKQTDTDNGHRLAVMAKLIVSFPASEQNKNKISFWRYIDGEKDSVPLKADFASYALGVVTYNVYVPGFSTIVATVDQTTVPVIEPPKETIGGGGGGGSSSGSSYSGLSFTSINPGTGTVTYTTNHPDWPATTFTFNRMTALGVLLASGKSVVSAERWGGVYIHSINGLSPASDSEGWMYQVNGISPGAMANNYPVSNGDKVVWYYSEDMTKPVSASKQVYAFTVSTSAAVSEIAGGSTTAQPGQTTQTTATTVKPAETSRVTVGIPDGINVEKLEIGQKITIDTAVTKLTGTVNVNSRSIVIIQPGIQINIPLADVVYNGDIATATIRGMTAEIVPAPVTVPKGGYAV